MAGYGRVVVGYRFNDRRRFTLANQEGGMVEGGKCISCGAPTFFVRSGQDAVRYRDANVMCDEPCFQRYKHLVENEL
jgi:hypothetical protein